MNPKFVAYLVRYYGLSVLTRGPSYIIASLAMPLTLLFIVSILSGGRLIQYAIIGGFLSLIASNALSSAGDSAYWRLQLRMQDLLVTTRVTPTDYMMGLTLSYLVGSSPGIAIYTVLGVLYGLFNPVNAVLFAGIIALVVVSTSSIAFIAAGLVKHIRNIWGIAGILSVVMTLLPPTFYPYGILPTTALYVLSVSPVTPAAVLSQGLFGLGPIDYYMVYILIAETLVYFAVARFLTVWREH